MYLWIFLVKNKLISEKQHGFVPGKSCVKNLLETFEFLTNALSGGHNVAEILLDLSKAFDIVPHIRLIHKTLTVLAGLGHKTLAELDLTCLKDRRVRGDSIQIFKIMKGLEVVEWEKHMNIKTVVAP